MEPGFSPGGEVIQGWSEVLVPGGGGHPGVEPGFSPGGGGGEVIQGWSQD